MNTSISAQLLKIQICPDIGSADFFELIIQFGINLTVLLILARAMYYRWNRNPEYMFAQLIIGVIVFMICSMLRWVQLELGLVLGLFAIFAIIRFRTLNVPIKEMAYLFMTVGISAINALIQPGLCPQWIIFSNIFLIALTYTMEKGFFSKRLSHRTITFNNTNLLKPSNHKLLLAELRNLTELNIMRFEIGKVDYIKGHAQIRIFFTGDGNGSFNDEDKQMDDD